LRKGQPALSPPARGSNLTLKPDSYPNPNHNPNPTYLNKPTETYQTVLTQTDTVGLQCAPSD